MLKARSLVVSIPQDLSRFVSCNKNDFELISCSYGSDPDDRWKGIIFLNREPELFYDNRFHCLGVERLKPYRDTDDSALATNTSALAPISNI